MSPIFKSFKLISCARFRGSKAVGLIWMNALAHLALKLCGGVLQPVQDRLGDRVWERSR